MTLSLASKGELRELQPGGCGVESGCTRRAAELYVRHGIVAFEGLNALDGHGDLQGVVNPTGAICVVSPQRRGRYQAIP